MGAAAGAGITLLAGAVAIRGGAAGAGCAGFGAAAGAAGVGALAAGAAGFGLGAAAAPAASSIESITWPTLTVWPGFTLIFATVPVFCQL